jgi:[acyl-carrier-protein] S-malonyltransferase
MRPAQERLAVDLARLSFCDPVVPLVNNVDVRPVRGADECRDGLVRQVSAPVRWQECAERLAREGVDTFVEVGPGTVLSGLLKKIAPSARVLNVGDPATLEKTVAALHPAALEGA